MQEAAPQIIAYDDYREFLKDLFLYKHSLNAAFSRRRFSQIAGFKSPNYFQLVVDGKRNLTEETAINLAKGFKFSVAEKEILLSLVKKASAKTEKDLKEAEKYRLLSIKRLVSKQMPTNQGKILSEWYHMSVRELILLKSFRPQGQWISEKLFGLITPVQAEESLKILLEAGFVAIKNSRYVLADPVITAETKQFRGAYLKKYHADTLKVWSENLSKMSESEQEAIVLNIPIDSKKIPELKLRVNQFIDELIGWLQDDPDADQVIQLGSYIVPFK